MTAVAVAGGGLAGLVAARTLAADGVDVTVFERRETVGGRVRTAREDGFQFDRGFQVLFPNYPAVADELDLEALDLQYFRPGAIIARPGERSTLSDPLRDPRALTASLFNREVTTADKLRTLKLRREMARKPLADILAAEDVSIEEYLDQRGFSRDYRENFAAPFYGGITLDRSLSTSSVIFEYTFKMLAGSSAAVPAAGMQAIPEQLAAGAREAGATIETGTAVEAVDPHGDAVVVETGAETVEADTAVVATDPKTARDLTGVDVIPTESDGCVTQQFSLPKSQRLDMDSRLVLNAADGRPNTVAPMSDAAPEYAPDGTHLLSATFLGEPDGSDDELADEVRETLAAWYPENSFADLELLRTDRIPFSQFTQPPGFRAGLPTVDAPDGPVYLAGEYTEWSSIQGAMESGRKVARMIQ